MNKQTQIKPRLLKGFRDYMPPELLARRSVIERAARVFESFGFQPIDTPALEYSDVLTGKYGEEGDKLLYRFRDNGDRDVSLRYDLTVPLARVVAMHRPVMPFKRYQVAPVWRAEKPAKGRFREFLQFDIDVVGAAPPVADAEVVIAGISALRAIGIEDFKVRLNHRGLLNAVLRSFGVSDTLQEDVIRSLDKLEKAGVDAVTEMIAKTTGSVTQAGELTRMVAGMPGTAELSQLVKLDADGQDSLDELQGVMGLCRAAGMGDYIRFDLSIARGLDYYTGVVFETQLLSMPRFGSVMSGGRYDGLIGMFMGERVPAVGISIGIDRLVNALEEAGLLKSHDIPVEVEVLAMGKDMLEPAFAVATIVRDAGYSCEIYTGFHRKLKAQLSFSAKKGVKFCVILGPDEVSQGNVVLRDMINGSQQVVRLDMLGRVLGGGNG